MYADMQALQDIGQRVEVIQRALAHSNNTLAFCEQYAEETAALAAKVKAARELLPQVEVSDAMLMLAAQLCSQAFVPAIVRKFICSRLRALSPPWRAHLRAAEGRGGGSAVRAAAPYA